MVIVQSAGEIALLSGVALLSGGLTGGRRTLGGARDMELVIRRRWRAPLFISLGLRAKSDGRVASGSTAERRSVHQNLEAATAWPAAVGSAILVLGCCWLAGRRATGERLHTLLGLGGGSWEELMKQASRRSRRSRRRAAGSCSTSKLQPAGSTKTHGDTSRWGAVSAAVRPANKTARSKANQALLRVHHQSACHSFRDEASWHVGGQYYDVHAQK